MPYISSKWERIHERRYKKMTESVIGGLVKSFLLEKADGNWHEEKVRQAKGHRHGPDLVIVGGSHNGERFVIECKGRSYAKSADSINKEGWLNAVGQLVTRMDTERHTKRRNKRADQSRLTLWAWAVLGRGEGCLTPHSQTNRQCDEPVCLLRI